MQPALGQDNVVDMGMRLAGDDFTYFGLAGVKALVLHVGAVARARQQEALRTGVPLPIPHSPLWAPEYQPTLKVAMRAQAAILVDLLQRAGPVAARQGPEPAR
jgi:hippurate hydrolase